jgi:DNA invertase Pin-like site-specific DNA recombinase
VCTQPHPETPAEDMALATARGVYKGRPRSLAPDLVTTVRQRVAAGEPKARIDLGISRSTLYDYLRDEASSGGA